MMKKECKVSIIMPSLNVAPYIDECIRSALSQTLSEKEIICVDAGSTDGTWEKLSSYAKIPEYEKEIKLIHCNIKSYGYQVNFGIDQAVGEYIAVLETDDYVTSDMYEYLYNIGKSNDADFVKADYDAFITCPGGEKIFNSVKLFKNKKEYGKVIIPSQSIYLYAHDHSIWKGIYKRDFLLRHHIRFNESKGAAFQDIGFTQQVLSCARRALYVDKSFYRYRKDRELSSVNSISGLKYSYGEFVQLLRDFESNEKAIYADGLFVHMVLSLECELMKTLRGTEYDTNSELIKPYYMWFKEKILMAIDRKLLTADLYGQCPNLHLILGNLEEFSLRLQKEDTILKEQRERILNAAKDSAVVIFGAGGYGRTIIEYLYEHNIKVHAICDNNNSLWDTEKYSLRIYSPAECVRKFKHDIYIVANKKYSREIREQLLNLGVKENNIFSYSAAGIEL